MNKHWLFLLLIAFSSASLAGDDASDIAALLSTTFDKPDAKVVTQPVVVEGDFALADWLQGHHGGRALLAHKGGQWKILSCGGAGLTHPQHLEEAGIPPHQAQALAGKLRHAETTVEKLKIQQFDAFQGERQH